jgi:hypothetical protein
MAENFLWILTALSIYGIVPGIVPDDFFLDFIASDKNYIHIYFIKCKSYSLHSFLSDPPTI